MKKYINLEICVIDLEIKDVLTYSSEDNKDNLGDDPFVE